MSSSDEDIRQIVRLKRARATAVARGNDGSWRSCCFRLDVGFTVFAAQFILSACALALCCIELHRSDGKCEIVAFYGNVLTTLIGLWMPSPLTPQR